MLHSTVPMQQLFNQRLTTNFRICTRQVHAILHSHISIKRLKCFAYHGVLDEEAQNGQHFYVDIKLAVDTAQASRSDELTDTIDYGALTKIVKDDIENGKRVKLIETLCSRVADKILSYSNLISLVEVCIHKPQAPVDAIFDDISVTIAKKPMD